MTNGASAVASGDLGPAAGGINIVLTAAQLTFPTGYKLVISEANSVDAAHDVVTIALTAARL